MGVPPCSSCKHCGSDLSYGPESHSEPEPHTYIDQYDQNTGAKYEMCRLCHRKREELEAAPEPETLPPPLPDPYLSLVPQYPHCDAFVLHVFATCEYCDLPEMKPLREYREANNINCTGENNPDKKPCPAEVRRSKKVIDKWPGNQAK